MTTACVAADGFEPAAAGGYFDTLPVVLTPSRLPQPLDEAPAAVTVIDHDMILAYHGVGNDSPAEMQVLIDGSASYLFAIGPRADLGYARSAVVPLTQGRDMLSQSMEVQYRLAPTTSTQVVWGGAAGDEWLESPELLYDKERLTNRLIHLFANLEWRLANVAGTVEKYSDDHARISPCAFLNWHASPVVRRPLSLIFASGVAINACLR